MTPRPRIAFATSSALPHGIPEDAADLPRAFADAGADAAFAVWDDAGVDWGAFDGVLVRTCWDYYLRPRDFIQWLNRVEALGVPVWNPPAVIRWNHDKRYLRALEGAGVRVVPTRWIARGERSVDLAALLAEAGWTEAVVKPAVSAGAHETWRVRADDAASRQADLLALTASGDVLVQPFVPEVVRDGEWSFVFFGGEFSHAVLKRPATGDYRVQPQHGGATVRAAPTREQVADAAAVLAHAPAPLAYARVDGVFVDGAFTLMELEALEPRLFLDLAPGAAGALARAVIDRLVMRA